MSFIYTLRKGDEGQEVKRLQSKLPTVADGKFGSKTEAEVRAYQQHNGLGIDGIAGPQTLGNLGIEVFPGIDVSSHNGTIDFKKVREAGVRYAWIKITEGTTHQNPGFQKKFDDARDAGIIVGAYHFGRPDTYAGDSRDWEKEADNFLLQLEKAGLEAGDLVPMLDVENGVKTDDSYNCEWYLNWLYKVGCETKVKPIVYTARWAWQLYVMKAEKELQNKIASYPLWLASYNSGVEPERTTTLWDEWDVWQWTGSGAVPGIRGDCDQNWMAGEQLDKLRVP
mgnify:FL=1|tara:strand:+ start:411 stop:1253 length:843 start_codon:yes stop_codon:yes gene_type:complete